MKKQQKKTMQGFTIIEVVLVLAIAGLIFLMVFVALPSLQGSQRDTQRRDNYSLLATAVTNYQTNNNGKMPTSSSFWTTYINPSDFQEPGGNGTTVTVGSEKTEGVYNVAIKQQSAVSGKPSEGQVWVVTSAKCNGESLESKTGGRYFAIYGFLESGVYCQDNS